MLGRLFSLHRFRQNDGFNNLLHRCGIDQGIAFDGLNHMSHVFFFYDFARYHGRLVVFFNRTYHMGHIV